MIGIRDSIGNILSARAAELPDRLAVSLDGHGYTFGQLDTRANTLAAGLARLGVRKGDRVATLAPNRIELLELYYGVARTGAAQVPLNAFLKGEFLRHQLAQSRASVLITDAAGLAAIAPLRAGLPDLTTIVTFDDLEGGVPYGELLVAGATPPDVSVTADDIMSIVYTSGTTGLPKGCIAPHGYYCRSADVIGTALEVDRDDVLFAGLPLFHSGARLVTVALPLLFGIPTHIQATFSASGYFPQAAEVGATLMVAVGAMAQAILATEPGPADRAHQVRRVMAAPVSAAGQQAFRDRFGVDPWVDIFGQSECFPVTATPLSATDLRDPAGCGRPAADLEVALLGDDGRVVSEGEVGEISVRPLEPYALFGGYFERPEETLEAFAGLWYHTGDYGKVLPSGAMAFVDRKKDALRRRGENISSLELEAGINGHPAVVESAVHSVPSDLGEDDVKACLVVSSAVEPEDLFAYFKDHLPYFTIPRYVEVFDELPRNGVGRVLKHRLREAGITGSTWDFEALGLTVTKEDRR
jgi:crotonobetaine/carnitine-CoA ligase